MADYVEQALQDQPTRAGKPLAGSGAGFLTSREDMVPELDDLRRRQIFSEDELRCPGCDQQP